VVNEGEPAPDFTLTSDAGERVSLSDLRGKPVVLYFYPKDDTRATNRSNKVSPCAEPAPPPMLGSRSGEGSMEFIDVLVSRRLQRELLRREAALREADRTPFPTEQKYEAPIVQEAVEPKPDLLVEHYSSRTQGRWECDFCGRGFHGYGQFLNHNCRDR
jgi:AhpC/TSA family